MITLEPGVYYIRSIEDTPYSMWVHIRRDGVLRRAAHFGYAATAAEAAEQLSEHVKMVAKVVDAVIGCDPSVDPIEMEQ